MAPDYTRGVEVSVLVLLASLVLPAVAARPSTLTVSVQDAAGASVPTAAVVVDIEDDRHPVNSRTGSWIGDSLLLRDGTQQALMKGTVLTGWVVAPGFEPSRFRVELRRRRQQLDVTLSAMDTRASTVPLPQADEAGDVRRALRVAAAALQEKDLRTAAERIDAAERAKLRLEGDPYVDSTLAIMEMRTLVALSAWNAREARALVDASEANMHALNVSRGVTADLALDWRDYARGAGRDAARAVALCRTASGRSSRCD